MENKLTKGDSIYLDEDFVVFCVPSDTVELDVTAKVYVGGELHEVTRHLDFPEVRSAVKEAENIYAPPDALFMLAPTRRQKIKALLDKYFPEEEDDE